MEFPSIGETQEKQLPTDVLHLFFPPNSESYNGFLLPIVMGAVVATLVGGCGSMVGYHGERIRNMLQFYKLQTKLQQYHIYYIFTRFFRNIPQICSTVE